MMGSDLVKDYAERARSVGTRVECVARGNLAVCLTALLDRVREGWEKSRVTEGLGGAPNTVDLSIHCHSGESRNPGLMESLDPGFRRGDVKSTTLGGAPGGWDRSPGRQAVLSAAVPAEGWPAGLREAVESVLESCGFRTVSPCRNRDGYGWDRDELARAILGVTYCNAFLADTGSLVVPARQGFGTLATLLPEVHLALSDPEGCLGDLGKYLSGLEGDLPSRFTLVTGPSRTGDIEASMTTGVHGPREVHHWILV